MDNDCHSNGIQHETKDGQFLASENHGQIMTSMGDYRRHERLLLKPLKEMISQDSFKHYQELPVVFQFGQILEPFAGQSL